MLYIFNTLIATSLKSGDGYVFVGAQSSTIEWRFSSSSLYRILQFATILYLSQVFKIL